MLPQVTFRPRMRCIRLETDTVTTHCLSDSRNSKPTSGRALCEASADIIHRTAPCRMIVHEIRLNIGNEAFYLDQVRLSRIMYQAYLSHADVQELVPSVRCMNNIPATRGIDTTLPAMFAFSLVHLCMFAQTCLRCAEVPLQFQFHPSQNREPLILSSTMKHMQA
jgi:hypothetical protein